MIVSHATVANTSTPLPVDAGPVARPCPICGGRDAAPLHHQRYALFDDSDLPVETTVVACDDCGSVYASSNATALDYRRHYAKHSKYDTASAASGSGEMASDRMRLEQLVDFVAPTLDPTAAILDVGAGRGGLLDAFRRRGFARLSGIDPSTGCVDAMMARGLAAWIGELEQDHWPTDPRRFDLVVLSHVLEHVYDVSDVFARAARRVTPEGALYIEVPDAARYSIDGFPPFYFFDPEHINHLDAVSLERLGARCGWTVAATWPRVLDLDGGQRYPAIGMVLRRPGAGGLPLPSASVDRTAAAAVVRYVRRSTERTADAFDAVLAPLVANRAPVVLWGAGSHAQRLLAQTALGRCVIACVIDADPGKQGRRIDGHRVVSPEDGLRQAAATGADVVVAIAVGAPSVVARVRATLPAARVVAV